MGERRPASNAVPYLLPIRAWFGMSVHGRCVRPLIVPGTVERGWSAAGHVMRCNLLKVVAGGKTLAMRALMGVSGPGKSTLGMPRPARAARVAGRRCLGWQATLG
jgi:hypothetical protein